MKITYEELQNAKLEDYTDEVFAESIYDLCPVFIDDSSYKELKIGFYTWTNNPVKNDKDYYNCIYILFRSTNVTVAKSRALNIRNIIRGIHVKNM